MKVVKDGESEKEVQADPEHLMKISSRYRNLLLNAMRKPDGSIDHEKAIMDLTAHVALHLMKIDYLEETVRIQAYRTKVLEGHVNVLDALLAQNGISPGISRQLKVDLNPNPPPSESES